MCDMGASLIVSGLSTALSMAGQMVRAKQASSAAQAQADYQRAVLDQRKSLAERQAQDAVQRGIEEKNQQLRKAAGAIGEQKSALAASGLVLDSGSPMAILTERAEEAQHDADKIGRNAAREAWGYQMEANDAANEHSLVASRAKNAARQARAAAAFGAGSSLLGGISAAMGQYRTRKKPGGYAQ